MFVLFIESSAYSFEANWCPSSNVRNIFSVNYPTLFENGRYLNKYVFSVFKKILFLFGYNIKTFHVFSNSFFFTSNIIICAWEPTESFTYKSACRIMKQEFLSIWMNYTWVSSKHHPKLVRLKQYIGYISSKRPFLLKFPNVVTTFVSPTQSVSVTIKGT